MSKRWIPLAVFAVASMVSAPTWAGYDFEPPSLRSFMRFWGIGPGPGYHAVPCMPRSRLHYRCVTRGFSPMPVESDYFPVTQAPLGFGDPTSMDSFLPHERGESERPTPLPEPEVVPPSAATEPTPAPLVVPTPVPPPPAPRPFPIETRQQPDGLRETPVHSLLDELLQEQEIKLREVDDLLRELGPPPLPEAPAAPPAKPISTAGDSWW